MLSRELTHVFPLTLHAITLHLKFALVSVWTDFQSDFLMRISLACGLVGMMASCVLLCLFFCLLTMDLLLKFMITRLFYIRSSMVDHCVLNLWVDVLQSLLPPFVHVARDPDSGLHLKLRKWGVVGKWCKNDFPLPMVGNVRLSCLHLVFPDTSVEVIVFSPASRVYLCCGVSPHQPCTFALGSSPKGRNSTMYLLRASGSGWVSPDKL